MSYILRLGHQLTDIAGISGLLSTTAGGFDAMRRSQSNRGECARSRCSLGRVRNSIIRRYCHGAFLEIKHKKPPGFQGDSVNVDVALT
jgi:hypothetical protein